MIGAFGRLGTWFGVDRFGLRPDMITFAKGVTSGYLPLGGVVVSGRVAEPFWTPREDGGSLWFRHGQTYSGHPTCWRRRDGEPRHHRERGAAGPRPRARGRDRRRLRAAGRRRSRGEIRTGIGALGAVAFDKDALAAHPDLPARTFAQAKARGVLVRPLGDAVAISPPLVATREQIDAAAQAIGEAVAAVAESLPAVTSGA